MDLGSLDALAEECDRHRRRVDALGEVVAEVKPRGRLAN